MQKPGSAEGEQSSIGTHTSRISLQRVPDGQAPRPGWAPPPGPHAYSPSAVHSKPLHELPGGQLEPQALQPPSPNDRTHCSPQQVPWAPSMAQAEFVPSHSVRKHRPSAHEWPDGQGAPGLQLGQVPSQGVPTGQAAPHASQLSGSRVVSTHIAPQQIPVVPASVAQGKSVKPPSAVQLVNGVQPVPVHTWPWPQPRQEFGGPPAQFSV